MSDSPKFVDWMSSQTWSLLAMSTTRCFMIGQIIPLLPQHSHPVQMHRWRSFGNSRQPVSTREFAISPLPQNYRIVRAIPAGLNKAGNSNMDARRCNRAAHFTRFARSFRYNLTNPPRNMQRNVSSSRKTTNNSRKSSK